MVAGHFTVVYCILHYLDSDMTVQCIETIRKVNGDENHWIVIVDNGSKNGSSDQLRTRYADNECIITLEARDNLGFAAGNNIGYRYAKEMLNADIVLVMNNDVLIEPSVSAASLRNTLRSTSYALVGPRIINLNGNDQNPMRSFPLTNLEIVIAIFKNLSWLGVMSIPLITKWMLDRRDLRVSRRQPIERGASDKQGYADLVLHGACVIYTQHWILNENVAFVPGTFMYMEEDILFDYARAKCYKTGLINSLIVRHLEDHATRCARPNREERFRFTTKEHTRSLLKLLYFRARGRWPVG